MNKTPKVSIVIANWNGKGLLKDCLTSIFSQIYANYDVILVDNGSTDKSVEYIKNNFSKVKLIELNKNYGFAKANNIGIKEALKCPNVKYIITLNNDTQTNKNWLSSLVKVMEADGLIGSAQSKTLFFYEKNKLNNVGILICKDGSACNRGINEKNIGYDNIEEIFGTSAVSAIYRREALEEVGLFDEDFFAYMEDVDLAWRLRLNGWRSLLVPNSRVYHVHSATAPSSKFKIFLINRNSLFVLIKNLPLKYVVLFPINYIMVRMYFLKTKKDRIKDFKKNISLLEVISIIIKSWICALRFLPKLLKKRRLIQKNKKISSQAIDLWFYK